MKNQHSIKIYRKISRQFEPIQFYNFNQFMAGRVTIARRKKGQLSNNKTADKKNDYPKRHYQIFQRHRYQSGACDFIFLNIIAYRDTKYHNQ